ncbi:MAG TPA: TolC family protein [Gemmatimonadales bacterium]|nr:TolC family protein [Gemmatimonadales bacterium]
MATLSLSDALTQAKNNNPTYRQRLYAASTARAQVRNAYGKLLPTASVGAGMNYTGQGQSNLGQGFTFTTPAVIGSSYNIGLQWQIDGSRILAPKTQKANQHAVEEDIANEESNLRYTVTQQYLTGLQSAAQIVVARQQVVRNKDFLELAQAKYQVGQGTLIDVRQAEVQKAQSDVALLQSIQTDNEAKIELFRLIGVAAPLPVDQIALSDTFQVTQPTYNLKDLMQIADEQNASIRALTARSRAADASVTSAKTAYLPSLSMQASWSGFTQDQTDKGLLVNQALTGAQASAAQCVSDSTIHAVVGLPPLGPGSCNTLSGLNAGGTALNPALQQSLIDANSRFPFHFQSQPFVAFVSISLPIFTGFSRSLAIQQAREQAQDAEESVRAQVLQVHSDVQSRFLALQTAYQAIAVQAQSRDAARDQLRLAEDRYRLGSGTSLEVSDAQNNVQRAEGDYVNAIYAYHKALSALEFAVGRPLR